MALALLAVSCGGRTRGAAEPAPVSPTTAAATSTTTLTAAGEEPVAPPQPPAGPVRYASPYTPLATPAALAADIAQAEATARDRSQPPAERAKAGRRLQVRYRQLVDTPAWDADVQRALPSAIRDPARRNVEAGRLLLSMFKVFPPDMPPWEIVDPKPPPELLAYYHEAQAAIGVEWTYLAAVNFVETKMGRIRGTSTAGARGPMQFLPSSWKAFGAGGDIEDARDSILAGARHLVDSGGRPFDIDRALYGYNHSKAYVAAVKDYAAVLRADPEAYVGYHAWETFYRTDQGDQLLPKGYKETTRVPVSDYLKRPVVTIDP